MTGSGRSRPLTLDGYFEGYPESRRLFDALEGAIADVGPAELRVTRSQVAFRRPGPSGEAPFAWAWIPGKYLRGGVAPLVLSLAFDSRDPSPRFKEVVEPTPGRFMHHLEVRVATDLDATVRAWLQRAWDAAGREREGS